MTTQMRRNSPKMLATRLIEAGKLYLPVLILYLSTPHGFDGWQQSLWTVFFWYYTYTRVYFVLFDWYTTRYRVTTDGIVQSRGLFVKDEILIRWNEMASVQVSRPIVQRVVNCSLVRIGIGSKGKRSVILEATPPSLAQNIAELFRLNTGGSPEDGDVIGSSTTTEERRVIYKIRKIDYVMIAVTYGHFALFIPFVVSLYSEVARWLPLPRFDIFIVFGGAVPSWTIAWTLVAVCVAALAYGCAIAWLRYRSLTVAVDNGILSITGGLLSHESRQVTQAQVRGLKLQQNPLMRMLGYAKLSLVSRESAKKIGTNVIFPAVKMDLLAAGVEAYFPKYVGILHRRWRSRKVLAGLGLLLGSAAVVGSWLLVGAVRPAGALAAAGVLAVVLLVAANYLWTSIDIDRTKQWIHFRRGFMWVTRYEVPTSSVHVVTQSQGPLGRWCGISNSSVYLFDARRVRLRLVGYPELVLSRISDAVRSTPDVDMVDTLTIASTPKDDRDLRGSPALRSWRRVGPRQSGVATADD